MLAVLAAGDAATAQSLPQTCDDDPLEAGYLDRDEIATVHLDAVDCATQIGIARGLGTDQGEVFLPGADVRRDQMASFVARTLTEAGVELPDLGDPEFTDVEPDATHADAIAQLAAAGIVNGVDENTYDPSSPVRRDQMASFLVRALAYQAGVEVQDVQGGDTPFTDVGAGGTHGPNIQGLYNLGITDGFTVSTGLVTDAAVRVAVEHGGSTTDLDLIATRSAGLRAWASPILAEDVDAIVAYDDADTEIARTAPDDLTSPPFPADTSQDVGVAQGDPVVLTGVDLGRHGTYDRAVFEVDDGGHAGWEAEYVEQATAQGSGQSIAIEGDAILRLTLTNMNYPTESTLDQIEPGTRYEGVGDIAEVYVGTTFEGTTQIFVGVPAQTPFRVFSLDDPTRIVLDVVRDA